MRQLLHTSVLVCAFVLATRGTCLAQLHAAAEGPIVYGHHHINPSDPEAHRRFWVDTLGGVPAKLGTGDVIKYPNVILMLSANKPTGGTKTSSVNHIGFQVPNLRAMVDRLRAAGYPIVTRTELPPSLQAQEKDGIVFIADQNSSIAFVMGPDDTKVELFEVKGMKDPIALHHIHFATPQVAEMQAWYAKVFGAKPGKRGSFDAAALPGVSLTFSPSAEPVVGTKGRVLDHIGFEVKDLEAFTKRLEGMGIKLDRPFTKIDRFGITIAFLTDPWGTNVELTEGMTQVR